jgi:hypothetical protein
MGRMLTRKSALLLLLMWPAAEHAQEVKYVDLTSVHQRKELRNPPASPVTDEPCNATPGCIGVGAGGGIGSVADGAPDSHDPHALGISLLTVSPSYVRPEEPFTVEFKVLNTGSVSLDLPISPNLSDLQPEDSSADFDFLSLGLAVRGSSVEPSRTGGNCLGYVELFGTPKHPDTMAVLKPGEWIRVKANITLFIPPSEPGPALFRGDFWLHRTKFHPYAGGSSTQATNLYPNNTPTPAVSVWLLSSGHNQMSK